MYVQEYQTTKHVNEEQDHIIFLEVHWQWSYSYSSAHQRAVCMSSLHVWAANRQKNQQKQTHRSTNRSFRWRVQWRAWYPCRSNLHVQPTQRRKESQSRHHEGIAWHAVSYRAVHFFWRRDEVIRDQDWRFFPSTMSANSQSRETP